MRAVCLIRSQPEYRAAAFQAGLAAAGYTLAPSEPGGVRDPGPGDVLVIWNRYGRFHAEALRFEAAGAAVIVVENGYLDPRRTSWHARFTYAMALGGHNGSGRTPGRGLPIPAGGCPCGCSRLEMLDVEENIDGGWSREGEHILVCGQRGIGAPGMASPPDWEANVARRLRALTDRPIRIRRHPGNQDPAIPVAADLNGAWACVVWSSGCAVAALQMDIPVFFEAPAIIVDKACHRGIARIERPDYSLDRIAAFIDLAWAQWTVEEIAAGVPFRVLLGGGASRRLADPANPQPARPTAA